MADDKKEEYLLGIDEAGRGPVLGSMVYGACWCPLSKKQVLSAMGFADSKVLTADQREKLFADIKQSPMLKYKVDVITSQDISAKMLRRHKHNLNLISHLSAMGLIQAALEQGFNIQEVYVDTVGTVETYQAKLKKQFPGIRSIVVAKKADSLFPIVSAASICAKVTRDSELENWVFRETSETLSFNRNWGSGYPADPSCKRWLSESFEPLFGWPDIVRFSWSTAKKIIKAEGIPVDWDDEEDDDDDEDGEGAPPTKKTTAQKLTQFYAPKASETNSQNRIPLQNRYSYFKSHQMHVVTNFSD